VQRVKDVLSQKGAEIFAIEPERPVLEALREMAQRHVGALLVMRGAELLGVISERDYARKVVLLGRSSADTPVSQIMTATVVTVAPEATVHACMALMTEKRIRHLPVLAQGKLLGVVSIGDMVKAVIEDQRHQIEDLERFIHG